MQETTFVMVFEGINTEEQEALCSFLLLHTNSFIKGGGMKQLIIVAIDSVNSVSSVCKDQVP